MIDIDKLEQLEKAATPRPWLAKANELLWVGPDSLARHGRIVYPTLEDECIFRDGNAELIAAVRNALPELLAEVRRLRADLRTAVDLLYAVEQDQVQGEVWYANCYSFLDALAAKEPKS